MDDYFGAIIGLIIFIPIAVFIAIDVSHTIRLGKKKQFLSKKEILVNNDEALNMDYMFGETDIQEDTSQNIQVIKNNNLDKLLNEMNDLIGLNNVKQEISTLINSFKIKKCVKIKV